MCTMPLLFVPIENNWLTSKGLGTNILFLFDKKSAVVCAVMCSLAPVRSRQFHFFDIPIKNRKKLIERKFVREGRNRNTGAFRDHVFRERNSCYRIESGE